MAHDSNCAEQVNESQGPGLASAGAGRLLSPDQKAGAVDASRALAAVLARLGVSQAQLARAIGVTRETVRDWCAEDHPKTPPLRDLYAMRRCLPSVYRELLVEMAEAAPEPSVPLPTATEQVSTTHAALVCEVVRAMADGAVDDEEHERIEQRRAAHECATRSMRGAR